MKKLVLVFGLTLALVAGIFYACKKAEDNLSVPTQFLKMEKNNNNYSTLRTGTSEISLTFFEKRFFHDDSKVIHASHQVVENDKFNDFINNLKQNIKGDILGDVSSPVAVVVYLNKSQEQIDYGDVKAISLFVLVDNKLQHRFFQVDGALHAHENSLLKKFISGFATGDFDILLDFGLKNEKSSAPTYILLWSKDFLKITREQRVGDRLSKIVIETTGSVMIGGAGGCDGGCGPGNGTCYDEYETGCEGCGIEHIDDVSGELKININIKNIFPRERADDFRDNFMKKYAKGREYIDYYYQLSYFMEAYKTVNLNNFWKHIALGKDMYNVADKLQYGNDNDVVITSSVKNDALAVLNDYVAMSANPGLLTMINSIRRDLNTFEGKTKKQVLQQLN